MAIAIYNSWQLSWVFGFKLYIIVVSPFFLISPWPPKTHQRKKGMWHEHYRVVVWMFVAQPLDVALVFVTALI